MRYPGGKAVLTDFLAETLAANRLYDGTYVEPFAGGAGAALNLLYGEYVQQIILNDLDPCVYAIWNAIMKQKNRLIDMIAETPVSIEEWRLQRDIYLHQKSHSRIKVAFASFFLNRCNRSGIIVKAGPIGGKNQSGKWKINARYNKDDLIKKIEKIHMFKDRIKFYNMDAISFLKNVIVKKAILQKTLVYLDPPYYCKGSQLYLNHFESKDHLKLSKYILNQTDYLWLMTYDDVPDIRNLYQNCHCVPFHLSYSVQEHKRGNELLIYNPELKIPTNNGLLATGS